MHKIQVQYEMKEISAFFLARFDMAVNEAFSKRTFFGRIKTIFVPAERPYCLVFIPWKHRMKELALIPMQDVLLFDASAYEDVVSVEKYISPFTQEYPYYEEYTISNFIGYQFLYDYKSFIADVNNELPERPLEILYQLHPELLEEEFDDEQ